MKRLFVCLLAGLLLVTTAATTSAFADQPIKLIVNGQEIQCDVLPQMINDRVLVPARFVAEPLGAKVEWDESNQAVIVSSKQQIPPPKQITIPQKPNYTVPENADEATKIEIAAKKAILEKMNSNGLIYRSDGYCYAVDMGNLLIYAAKTKDRQLFDLLLSIIKNYFIQTATTDDNALYTVVWRIKNGVSPDASGTTETLRVLEGVWLGYKNWPEEDLKNLAHKIALAYAKHQVTDPFGFWYICNYYNYQTRGYATNTYTIDYNPDLLFEIGTFLKDSTILSVAEKSRRFVLEAQIPSGLFHNNYDHEMRTIYPGICHFSPNNIIKPGDSAEIALTIAAGSPQEASKTLNFIKTHWPDIKGAYYANTEEPYQPLSGISLGHLSSFLRIASKLDPPFAERVAREVLSRTQNKLKSPNEPDWSWDIANALVGMSCYNKLIQ